MTIDDNVLNSDVVESLACMFASEYPPRSSFFRMVPQIPAMLSAVGACGGFAAQAAVWHELIVPGWRNPGDFLMFASTKSGETFYYGEAINLFLLGTMADHVSFLTLAAAALSKPSELPDIHELARHVARSLGSGQFGRPRLPLSVSLPELPRAALSRTWGKAVSILEAHRAAEWPALLGAAAYRIINANRDVLAQPVALRVVLEAAVPMSKLDPATVEQSGIPTPSAEGWSMRAIQPEAQQHIFADVSRVLPPMPPSIAPSRVVIAQPVIAFVNLCGTRCEAMATWDCAQIGAVFGDNVVTSTGAIPRCDVLFLYCDLTALGIAGQPLSVRDLIRESGARIVVVATEIPAGLVSKNETFPKVLDGGKSQPVNLVAVLERRGVAFRRYFRALFEHMLDGETMVLAWMKLSPQLPYQRHSDVPLICCMFEVANVTFRR